MTVYFLPRRLAKARAKQVREILARVARDVGEDIREMVAFPIVYAIHAKELDIDDASVLGAMGPIIARVEASNAERAARMANAAHVLARLQVLDQSIKAKALPDIAALIANNLTTSGDVFNDETILAELLKYRARSPKLFYSDENA